jgi:hypothetical protein
MSRVNVKSKPASIILVSSDPFAVKLYVAISTTQRWTYCINAPLALDISGNLSCKSQRNQGYKFKYINNITSG